MNYNIKLGMVTILFMSSSIYAVEDKNRDLEHSIRDTIANVTQVQDKEISIVDKFKKMFKKGKVTGNIRSIYSGFDNYNEANTYATALGGSFKYELAEFNGFNAGATMRTTNDIHYMTGQGNHHNPDLSSSKGANNQLSEAYLNYKHKGLNLRVGRQIIDTPLADSDDIRMTPDTFDAYTAKYEADAFSFMVAHLNAWQGYDTGLDNGWVKTGKDGVNFTGVSYSNENIDISGWYYNISNASDRDIILGADANGNNSFYTDISGHFNVGDSLFLHLSLQYLNQNELDESKVKANIYGTMAQLVYGDFSVGAAYNTSIKQKGKHSFSGYGGGTLYTSMDTMILDEITEDRNAQAIVTSLSYTLHGVNFLYAYGDFAGKENAADEKEHIVAQNIGIEYTTENELTLATVYVIHNNKEDSKSTFYNDTNFRILASYNF